MKPKTRKLVILIISAALVSLLCPSCGTVHGFGHDVETVGGNIEESSR